jgi:TRAP transporter TAXI family solute receptor
LNRKKLVALFGILVLVTLLALPLAACSSPAPVSSPSTSSSPSSASSTATQAKMRDAISVGSPDAGGGAYIWATSLSVMIQKYLGVTASPEAAGGAGGVLTNMGTGNLELAYIPSTDARDAYLGSGVWAGKAIPKLRLLNGGPVSIFVTVALASSGYKTIDDLRGKKVMYDRPSAPFFKAYFEALLEAHGMTTKDITPLQWTTQQQIADSLLAGTIDAGMAPDINPGKTATWLELSEKKPITLVGSPKEKLEAVIAKLGPGIMKVIDVPAGKYKGVDKPVPVISRNYLLAVNADIPEDFVYKILKMIWDDHLAEYQAYEASLPYFSVENTLQITEGIPFHPGTIKYYKEKGMWTDALQKMQDKLLTQAGK